MKELFSEYYPNTSEAIDLNVEGTVVVFDTNVLLNLYRYPVSASADLLRLMEGLTDKVWLPYHVALEYQRNRLAVIVEQKKRFREVRTTVEKEIAALNGELDKLQLVKKHSTIDIAKFSADIETAKNDFFKILVIFPANGLKSLMRV